MSLIDEALKRARMEAAQRAAESEGLPYPAIPRHLGPPRKRPVWLAVIALLLAVAGGVALGRWLAAGGPPAPAALAEVAQPPAAAPAVAAPEPKPVAGERVGRPSAPPVTAEPAPAPRPQPQPAAAETRTPPASSSPAPAAEPALPADAPAAGTDQSGRAAPLTDPDSGVLLVLPRPQPGGDDDDEGVVAERYLQQATLPGGAIELAGIAWSETGPFALINGRVVGPGAAVGRFTVETIGPEHVLLRGEGRRIRIDLR